MFKSLGALLTPLMLAAHTGQTEAAYALLAAGANATANSSCKPHASHFSHAMLLIASCVALFSLDTVPECIKGKNAANIANDAGHLDLAKTLREAAEAHATAAAAAKAAAEAKAPKFRRVRSALEQLQLLQLYDRLLTDVCANPIEKE
jgi:ankyrin repeat protein